MLQFFQQNGLDILARAALHLWIALIAVALAVLIGVPLGVFLARKPKWQIPVLRFIKVVQSVPSLALFGFLLPLIGPGIGNVLVALLLSCLLPIVRHTFAGITGVEACVREAARALGMTEHQRLRQVELPLATATIVAGIRTATVTSIGLTAIAAFVGAGGLGELILRGVRTGDNALVLAGALAVTLLAWGADGILSLAQKVWVARGRGATRATNLQRYGLASSAIVVVVILVAPQIARVLTPDQQPRPIGLTAKADR